jgi:diguanylate cyclase (GGDEF)-like protein/PAS domain S-box-containing protein
VNAPRASNCMWLLMHRLKSCSFALHLFGCFLSVALGKAFTGVIADGKLVWFANGILLAYLLLVPRRRWPAYIGAALLGHLAGIVAMPSSWQIQIATMPINLGETVLSATLLRSRSAQLPRFTDKSYLFRFFTCAVLAGPLAGAILNASIQTFWCSIPFMPSLIRWATTDALGVCVVTPAFVAIFRTHLSSACGSKNREWVDFLAFCVITYIVFAQARVPLAFLIYPLLILLLLRSNLGWAAIATLYITTVGGWFSIHHHGPFASSRVISSIEPAVVLQLFVVAALVMLYSVSVVIDSQRTTERSLKKIVALHKLVTENSRDVIILLDFSGHRSYVSKLGAEWGGWSKDELSRMSSIDFVHPGDRLDVEAIIGELRNGKDGALFECRTLNRDGTYTWIEANLRTLRNQTSGKPSGILINVRTITKRKLAEQRLRDAYHTLETMASTDVLTGLANRRSFDQQIMHEWRRCLRDRTPLSLLILDADLFKSYNDTYGHLRGDNCLKQIAEAAQDIVARSGDLVARIGGEEFAVILPNTHSDGALRIARDICEALRQRKIKHAVNPYGIVTISAGCATLVPQLGYSSTYLFDCADRAAYQAKNSGRNCVSVYTPEAPEKSPGDVHKEALAAKTA